MSNIVLINSQGGWGNPDRSILNPIQHPAPKLPLHMFGANIGHVMTEYAKAMSTPVDYLVAGTLAVTAAVIGMTFRVRVNPTYVEPPILWAAAVGTPGARKTPGLKFGYGPLEEIQKEHQDRVARHAEQINVHARLQALSRAAKTANLSVLDRFSTLPNVTRLPQFIVGQATKAALIDIAAETHQLLAVSDELSGFLANMKKGGADHRAFFLEAYNGSSHSANTKTGGYIRIPELAISITGGIQPEVLRSVVHGAPNDGLAARMLYFWPEPTRFVRPTGMLPANLQKPALQRILSVPRAADELGNPCPHDIPLSQPAQDAFYDWCEANDAAGHEASMLAGFMAKRSGLILRIALVTTVLRRAWDPAVDVIPQRIELDDILLAIEFVEGYATQQAIRVFNQTGFHSCLSPGGALASHIIEEAMTEVNVRDLKRGPKIPDLPHSLIDVAVKELVDKNWLRHLKRRESETAGRPQSTYALNPLV